MYVYMYVCDKNFVNFLKIGAYNFNFKYQSNGEGHLLIGEGHLLIDALGAPFWALGALGKAYQMKGTVSIDTFLQELCPKTGLMTSFFRSYAQKLG